MPARTPAAAVDALYEPLQRAASCLTPAVLSGRIHRPTAEPGDMTFGRGDPVRLGRDRRLHLSLRHRYDIVPAEGQPSAWSVRTAGYLYEVLDDTRQRVLAYHWHPVGHSQVTYPHLHIGGRTAPFDLTKAHLLAGPVTLVALIRMLITELDVEPLRLDWRDVLDQVERDLAEA